MTVPAELRPGAPLLVVGQAPGAREVEKGQPFVGPSGRELWLWAARAGFSRAEVSITNVWDREVPGLPAMTAGTKEAREEGWWRLGLQVARNRWLRPEWWDWEERLASEVAQAKPRLVLALGNEALWAASGVFGIEARRGCLFRTRWGGKGLATFHPAAILRGGFRLRAVASADLAKAWREGATPEWTVPRRELWIDPSIEDVRGWARELVRAPVLGVDIETARGEVTSIAFAPSPTLAFCVPFVVGGRSWWGSVEEEVEAWRLVQAICESAVPKVMQNGLYDAQWLWVKRRVAVRNYVSDPRLQHHALWPERPKSLAFLGSLWENETWWKEWGARGAAATEKEDD